MKKRTYALGEKEALKLVDAHLAENPKLIVDRVEVDCDCGAKHSAYKVVDYEKLVLVDFIVPCNQVRMEF